LSIGVAFYPDHGTDETQLTKNADAALYRAKSQGRNRVEVFHET
jgi:diguanylate cyclase (GGDEF)-like protein